MGSEDGQRETLEQGHPMVAYEVLVDREDGAFRERENFDGVVVGADEGHVGGGEQACGGNLDAGFGIEADGFSGLLAFDPARAHEDGVARLRCGAGGDERAFDVLSGDGGAVGERGTMEFYEIEQDATGHGGRHLIDAEPCGPGRAPGAGAREAVVKTVLAPDVA